MARRSLEEVPQTTSSHPSDLPRQARVAGIYYLLLALTAPFGIVYVPGRLIVSGNATATADNIRAHEWLLRVGIASELIHQVIGVFLVLALYRLFRSVNEALARQVVILGALVSVPIVFVNVLNDVAALLVVSGASPLSAFSKSQLDALAYLFLDLHGYGITVVSVFWGLWLFPFGMLIVRSGFIPRIFGILLWMAGAAYLACSFATLVVPRYAPLVSQVALPLQMGELPIVLWLLIRGATTPPRGGAKAVTVQTAANSYPLMSESLDNEPAKNLDAATRPERAR